MANEISKFLTDRIDAGDFPSAVYLIAEKGDIVATDALGNSVVEPEIIPARVDTIYDLASLTKVLVTTLLLSKLIEDGTLTLETRVAEVLEDMDLGAIGAVSIRELASHTAGLPGWLPFYLLVAERTDILTEIARRPRGEKNVVYGDPNFWVLTFVVERLYRKPITTAASTAILSPLGLKETFYCPPADLLKRVAASEKGTAFERQLCRELGFEFEQNRVTGKPGFRDEQIWGEVHDQNAWFFGNMCGHAGLFSTASGVFELAKQFLPSSTRLLRPETCSLFSSNLTAGLNEDRSFGFELASTPDSTAGKNMSRESFGHLGFTGTSLWIDPVAERVFVLLTNRTHAHGLPLANINPVRRQFHDLAVEHLDRNN